MLKDSTLLVIMGVNFRFDWNLLYYRIYSTGRFIYIDNVKLMFSIHSTFIQKPIQIYYWTEVKSKNRHAVFNQYKYKKK